MVWALLPIKQWKQERQKWKCFRGAQIFIAEIVKLLTPGRADNTPVDVTLVLDSRIGVSGK